jgi:hypothetical protein
VLHERGTLRDHLDLVTSFDEFGAIIDLDRHYALEARYREPAPDPDPPDLPDPDPDPDPDRDG